MLHCGCREIAPVSHLTHWQRQIQPSDLDLNRTCSFITLGPVQPYLRAADPDWIVIQETFWAGTFEGLPASHLAPLALTLYWKDVTFLKGGPQLTSLIQKTYVTHGDLAHCCRIFLCYMDDKILHRGVTP